MDWVEGNRGIYTPIEKYFDHPLYQECLELCFETSYSVLHTEILLHFLYLQQKKEVSPELTPEDVCAWLVKQKSNNLEALQLIMWRIELVYQKSPLKYFLTLAWKFSVQLKINVINSVARMRLNGYDSSCTPIHEVIALTRQAIHSLLLEKHVESSPTLLGPEDVLIELVPQVLQVFWTTPSTDLAVSIAWAVLDQIPSVLGPPVCFPRHVRNGMVISIQVSIISVLIRAHIQDEVTQYGPRVMRTIVDVMAREICVMFQPHVGAEI